MLKKIKSFQDRLLKNFNIVYKRYIFKKIDFNDKMIALFGARGVGKTTFLLQYLKELQLKNKKALYISLDFPFLNRIDLIDLVEECEKDGIEYLLLDEVHRYYEFSSYLKTIYDLFNLKIIFTSSSATQILNAKSDLSRRVTLYKLNGFSLREFLELKYHIKLSSFSLEDILTNHIEIINDYIHLQNILKDFKEYLKIGYYPFYFDKKTAFLQNLVNTINLTIDIDLTSLGLIEQKYTYKLKKLLEVVCESEPFEVNYTKIAAMAGISRVKLYDYIKYLDDGELLLLVDNASKGLKKLNKPAKIYLNNTNLLQAYCDSAKIGTLRETFFANQVSYQYKLNTYNKGDFLIEDKYVIEIGGAKKSYNQIKDINNSFLVVDDIEIGSGNKIPLWLFGFLYWLVKLLNL